ncbi:MAG: HAD family phosphatase [Pseudomonadota bacterium]
MNTTTVIFDVGNVLYRWEPERLYEALVPDPAARAHLLGNVVTTDWHFQHDAGRPFAETCAELSAAHPQDAALIAAWGPRFLESIPGPVAGMPELVADLLARQVPLYAITNFSGEFWQPFVAREAAFFTPFRGIIVSGDEKVTKPDPAIYRLALDRFDLRAEEAVFIDDVAANVAGAQAVGMRGIVFTDAATLRTDLAALGLI